MVLTWAASCWDLTTIIVPLTTSTCIPLHEHFVVLETSLTKKRSRPERSGLYHRSLLDSIATRARVLRTTMYSNVTPGKLVLQAAVWCAVPDLYCFAWPPPPPNYWYWYSKVCLYRATYGQSPKWAMSLAVQDESPSSWSRMGNMIKENENLYDLLSVACSVASRPYLKLCIYKYIRYQYTCCIIKCR